MHGVEGMRRDKEKHYRPTEKEPFMNDRQREYFRNKLLAWREDILKEAKETLQHLQDENQNHPDLADRASSETDRAIRLRARAPAQGDPQDRCRAAGNGGRHLRLLGGDRRADLDQAPRGPPDRDPVDRGSGTPRAARTGVSRRVRAPPTRRSKESAGGANGCIATIEGART